jgi:4'-phosphopantetheinyl transferase
VIEVIHVDLTLPAPAVHSPQERERAERFVRPEAARRWLAARAALRVALGERLGVAPEAVAFARGEHGKPEIAGSLLRFNLSHSGDLALIAFAPRDVGVDVERANRSARAVQRSLTPGERATGDDPLRIWCRKEALAKAIGTGLQWAPETFDTTAPGPYDLQDLEVPDGYLAALAVAR